jgi:hypothetical protein
MSDLDTGKHVVYWLEHGRPWFEMYTELGDCMKALERLREMRRKGCDISHITSKTELPGNCGLDGVAAPSPDYDWKKRRP